VAEEGDDSDIEAEENERYNRRPRAADGPVERSTESGFLARQPCRAALVAPTSHQVGYNTHEKPEHHLQLDFVYGYRSHDARHNLVYNIDGLITYPAVGQTRHRVDRPPQISLQTLTLRQSDPHIRICTFGAWSAL
jgi:microtubule-associated protein-like 6